MALVRFSLLFRQRGAHTCMRLFVPEGEGTGANCGSLTMRPHEAAAFFAALVTGNSGPANSNAVIEIDLDHRLADQDEAEAEHAAAVARRSRP